MVILKQDNANGGIALFFALPDLCENCTQHMNTEQNKV